MIDISNMDMRLKRRYIYERPLGSGDTLDIFGLIPLDEKKVSELARIAHHHNIAALNLHRYSGTPSKHPISSVLESLTADCRGYLDAMTDEEIVRAANLLPDWLRHLDVSQPLLPRGPIVDRLACKVVQWAVMVKTIDFRAAVQNQRETGIVPKRLPELGSSIDEDGLLILDDRFQLEDGGIFYKGFVLHYHQLLRRGYTSNPNFEFLGLFAKYFHETHSVNKFRVAIDHSRIMESQWYEQIMEWDTWYGPSFDPTKLDDPHAVGLTVVGRNQNSLFKLSNNLLYTDFLWTFRDGTKTFQVEEVSDATYVFGAYNFNRYIHSERDVEKRVLRHLDGAVKVYRTEDYPERVGKHLPDVPHTFAKPKLFRIDGDIDLKMWIDLVCMFMKGNEMVIEYLNPKAFEEEFELRVRDFEAWKRQQEKRGSE